MYEDRNDHLEEEQPRKRLPMRMMACLLLAVMLCTIVATPIVVFFRWNSQRPSRQQAQSTATPAIALAEAGLTATPTIAMTPTAADLPAEPVSRVDRIAFITRDQQLATMDPNGEQEHRLTDLRERFQFPAWSPDGSQLAVIGGNSVYVLPDLADRSAPRRIYQDQVESPFYLYWSPDSQVVSFLANHPDGIALHLSDADADQPSSRILTIGQPLYWDWTPDGRGIFIHTGLNGDDARLALIDPTGDGEEANIAAPGLFQAPGIARSGRYWAYAQEDDEGNSLLIVHDRQGEAEVIERHFGQVAFSWSPGGDTLAYTSPSVESGAFYGPLRFYDAETGRRQTLSPEIVVAYFWSPDGKRIAYLTLGSGEQGGTQAAGSLVRAANTVGAQRHGVQLALWVVDVETGFSRQLASFEPTPLFVSQFLPFFDQYALSHRLWSPDSDALVLPMLHDNGAVITVIDVESGQVRVVAEGTMAFWSQQ